MLGAIGKALDVVVLLQVDDAVATDRLLGRALEEGRADDAPEAIAKRLALYHEMTEPVADYYREAGSLETVDGERTPADVEATIQDVLHRVAGPR
jgi:adenylate kinase